MAYVDGYLIPLPKKNLADYRKMARLGCKMWKKYGALEYRECVGDDLKSKWGVSFLKAARAKPGETVIFAWIVYKSKAHRDQVNAKVMKDPEMSKAPKKIPFDFKKMAFGGFKIIVEA
jgi:uncharacterized protein YbaA (DUF1428 family)